MNLPPIPKRMQKLDLDPRGYPIPWNILRGEQGEAYFIVNDDMKHMAALVGNLCPICGQLQDAEIWFVGGPRSAFHPHGRYQDLPMHHECARFALQACPWLAAPNYAGRTDERRLRKVPPGIFVDPTQIADRPVLFVAVASLRMKAEGNPFMPYVYPVRPLLDIEYWRHGKQLDAAEGEKLVREIGLEPRKNGNL